MFVVDVGEIELNWLRRAARDFHETEPGALAALLGASRSRSLCRARSSSLFMLRIPLQPLPQPLHVGTRDEIAGMN